MSDERSIMSEQPSQFPPPPEAYPAPDMGGFPPQQAQPYPGYPPYQQQQVYQQGAWGGQPQFMPMPPAPKPPSPLTDPKALTEKLPLAALVVLCGFGLAGVLELVASFVSRIGGTGYALSIGVASLVADCMYGIVGFAVLMSLKYVIDLKNAKIEAAAAKEAAEAAEAEEQS